MPPPLVLQACLNGSRSADEHPAIPLTPTELALSARAAAGAGAAALHMHPRSADGRDTLEADACGAALLAVREGCPGIPVGLSTGAWMEPDVARRLAALDAWVVLPDYASVNFHEDGALAVCHRLLARGIGLEAGLWTPADANLLVSSGLATRCRRILVEAMEQAPAAAVANAAAIDDVLDRARIEAPRLHHGEGQTTWAVLAAAAARGRDVRVGLEDTLHLPDGRVPHDNAELVRAAVGLIRRVTSPDHESRH